MFKSERYNIVQILAIIDFYFDFVQIRLGWYTDRLMPPYWRYVSAKRLQLLSTQAQHVVVIVMGKLLQLNIIHFGYQ